MLEDFFERSAQGGKVKMKLYPRVVGGKEGAGFEPGIVVRMICLWKFMARVQRGDAFKALKLLATWRAKS